MARYSPTLTNFTAGALSPLLLGRVDITKYYNGASELTNMLVMRQGGARKRTGTRFVAEVKTSAKATRLMEFEFNVTQAYILEFGDQYIRFYRDGGQIESGGSPYEIASPYLEAELFQLQVAQSADVMWIVHPNHKPRKLTRTGHTSWTLSNYAPTGDPFTSANNYPACVAFHEQRLIFAATNTNPQRLFSTKSGDFENMTTGTADDDAWRYTIASGQVNTIRWLSGANDLLIGTAGGEFRATGSTDSGITPTSISIRSQTTYGSANIQPVRVDSVVLFVERSGRRVREYAYVFENDAYSAPDMTLLSDHLTGIESVSAAKAIVEVAYQREPLPVLWAVTKDGRLLGMTYERAQEVVAWHEHTTGAIESVASIPVEGGGETWVLVKRTVGGATKRYVERFDSGADLANDPEDAFYVDSGLTYDGSPVSSVSGLDHLEGQTVAILTDGATHPNRTVDSGAVSLQVDASVVHVGLPMTARLKTLPLALGEIPTIGKVKGWGEVAVLVDRTSGIKINGEQPPLRRGSDPMGGSVPLRSEVIRMASLGWNSHGQITIESEQPLPLTVLAVTGTVQVER